MKKIITLFFIVLLFNSCSFISMFFIVNRSDETVPVIITFDSPKNDNLELFFRDSIIKINSDTKKSLNKNLIYTKIDSATIRIEIPSKSTSFISKDFNKLTSVKSITFIRKNSVDKFDRNQFLKSTKRCGFLSPKLKFEIK